MNSGHARDALLGTLALVLISIASPPVAKAQPNVWIGPPGATGLGDWETATFWSLGVVPNTSASDVRIDNNPLVNSEVTVNQTQTIGSLTIDAEDALIIEPAVSLQASGPVQNSGNILVRVNNTGGLELAESLVNQVSGQIELEGGTLTSLMPSAMGGALLRNLGTIQGSGRIGLTGRPLSMINAGMIDANRAGSTLLLTGIGSGAVLPSPLPNYSNGGSLRASSGGTLRISGFGPDTPLVNLGGQIEALGSSTVNLLNARIIAGRISTQRTGRSGEGRIRIGGQVSLAGVEVDGQIDFDFNASLYDSSFTNLQTLHVGSNQLFINETVRIGGDGQVRLAAGGQIRGDGVGPSLPRFVNEENLVFMDTAGTAAIGVGMLVENGGTIAADGPARQLSLNLAGPAGHSPQQPAWMNSGAINATGGGRISLVGPARMIANGPTGVLEVDAASQFELDAAYVLGGTLRGPATMPEVGNGFQDRATLENVRLEGFVGSPEPLELVGTIENTGTLFGQVEISTPEVTLGGGGVVAVERFARENTSQFVELINEDNTIEVDGTVSLDTVQLVNRGIVEAVSDSPSNQLVSPGAQPRRVINRGMMRALDGNQLDLTGVVVQNHERETNGDLFPGTILAGAGSTVLVGDVFGGRLVAEPGGSLRAIDSNLNSTGLPVPLELSGIISAENLTFTGEIVNTGRLRAVGDIRVVSSSVLSGPGTFELGTGDGPGNLLIGENAFLQNASTHSIVGRGEITVDQTTLLNEGLIQSSEGDILTLQGISGTTAAQLLQAGSLVASERSQLRVQGFGSLTNVGQIETEESSYLEVLVNNGLQNRGTIHVGGFSIIEVVGSPLFELVENDGGQIAVDGSLQFFNAHLVNRPGSVVSGDGLISLASSFAAPDAPKDFTNQGVIAPGSLTAPGNLGGLTINGSFEQTVSGRLEIGVGRNVATVSDRLQILRNAKLHGELAIEFIDLGDGIYQPQLGDQFLVLNTFGSSSAIEGIFASLDAPTLDPGLDYRLFYGRRAIVLRITEPLTADFDGNSTLNQADLDQWQGDYGINDDSNANGDGTSDGFDFLAWQREASVPAPSTGGDGRITAAPEPGSGLLLALMSAFLFVRHASKKPR